MAEINEISMAEINDGLDSDFEEETQPNTENEVVWSFKRQSMQGVKFKVNFKMREGITQTIMGVLSHYKCDNFKRFRKSCFGQFTKLPGVLYKSGTTVHYFISREMEIKGGDDDPSEISFFIKGKRLRFRRYEYALVTGLTFGGSTFDPHETLVIPEESLYTRRFGNTPICVEQLSKFFVAMEIGNDPEDYLKVSKILFVYFFLLGLESIKTTVADWIWVLVEKNDEWETFPWGSYSYQHLVHYIKSIKRELANNGKLESYNIYGFSVAFMAWIYCAVPDLGITCGGVLSTTTTPRILRFRYNRKHANAIEITGNVYETLTPTPDETETPYWQSIEPRDTPFLLSYKRVKTKLTDPQRVSKNDADQAIQEGQCGRIPHRTAPSKNSGLGLSCDERLAWIDEICENMHKRIKTDENLITMVGESTFKFMRKDKSLIEDIGEYAAKRLRNELLEFLPGYMEYMKHQQDTAIAPIQVAKGSYSTTPMQNKEIEGNENTLGERMQSEKDPMFITPVQDKDLERDEIPDNDPIWSQSAALAEAATRSNKDYIDPNSEGPQLENAGTTYPRKLDFKLVRTRAASAVLSSPFRPYDRRGENYSNFLRSETQRNVGIGHAVSTSFFKEMADTKIQLSNSHIDAYLACLYTSPEFGKLRKYDKRITMTSTAFMPAIYKVFTRYHNDEDMSQYDPDIEEKLSDEELYELSKFVTGIVPNWGHIKPWHDYDKVIVVVHEIAHWVTCCVDLKDSCIAIYDSKEHEFDDTDYMDSTQFLIPLARVLPQVLRYAGFYDARQDITPCLKQWKVVHPDDKNLYKQTDSLNSGAYALKYVEAILTGEFEQGFGKKDLKNYKTHLAMSVYSFSTDVVVPTIE